MNREFASFREIATPGCRLVGEGTGLYTPAFGLSLTVLSSMVLLILVIGTTAASLNRTDAGLVFAAHWAQGNPEP